MDPASEPARALAAYAQGVNAWIDAMEPRDLPIEFRLLNRRPTRWRPEYTLYLLKRTAWWPYSIAMQRANVFFTRALRPTPRG